MKTLFTIILLIAAGSSAFGQQTFQKASAATASKAQASCCCVISPENQQLVLSYLDKLKDAYVSQDQGFLMSILDVDRDQLTDLYNEFMDEDILKAEIEDVTMSPASENSDKIESSFKLTREGYNFSDNKNVTLLWNISDPNHPKIIEVIVK